jgi:hypothetical protein
MKILFSKLETTRKIPQGFGVRQSSGAFHGVKSGRGLPQSKTLPRISGQKY